MNDWADYALGRLKQQEENQRLKDEKFVARRRLLKARGNPLWQEVRAIVRDNIASLNAKAGREVLVFEITQNSILKVRNAANPSRGVLQAAFDEEAGRLEWNCAEKSGSWELAVLEEADTVCFKWGTAPPTAPSLIAKEMLDALLFG